MVLFDWSNEAEYRVHLNVESRRVKAWIDETHRFIDILINREHTYRIIRLIASVRWATVSRHREITVSPRWPWSSLTRKGRIYRCLRGLVSSDLPRVSNGHDRFLWLFPRLPTNRSLSNRSPLKRSRPGGISVSRSFFDRLSTLTSHLLLARNREIWDHVGTKRRVCVDLAEMNCRDTFRLWILRWKTIDNR